MQCFYFATPGEELNFSYLPQTLPERELCTNALDRCQIFLFIMYSIPLRLT